MLIAELYVGIGITISNSFGKSKVDGIESKWTIQTTKNGRSYMEALALMQISVHFHPLWTIHFRPDSNQSPTSQSFYQHKTTIEVAYFSQKQKYS